jgi:ABC-type uncharacterized transport system ATPase subunit
MSMIETENLMKVYRTHRKEPGLWGAAKGLVRRRYEETRAADGVSFRFPTALKSPCVPGVLKAMTPTMAAVS